MSIRGSSGARASSPRYVSIDGARFYVSGDVWSYAPQRPGLTAPGHGAGHSVIPARPPEPRAGEVFEEGPLSVDGTWVALVDGDWKCVGYPPLADVIGEPALIR